VKHINFTVSVIPAIYLRGVDKSLRKRLCAKY